MTATLAKHAFYQYRTASKSPYLINGIALNGPVATRTLVLQVASPCSASAAPDTCWDQLAINVTVNAIAPGTVTTALEVSLDAGLTYAPFQAQDVNLGGVRTLVPESFSKAIAAPGLASYTFSFPTQGFTHVKLIFAGDASLFSVQATASST